MFFSFECDKYGYVCFEAEVQHTPGERQTLYSPEEPESFEFCDVHVTDIEDIDRSADPQRFEEADSYIEGLVADDYKYHEACVEQAAEQYADSCCL